MVPESLTCGAAECFALSVPKSELSSIPVKNVRLFPHEIMLVVRTSQIHLAAFLILTILSAAVCADVDVVKSAPNGREQTIETCASFYRLDDVTEINDEIE